MVAPGKIFPDKLQIGKVIKGILFRIAAILISLMIAALVAETALRLFAPGLGTSVSERSIFCRFDDELGWAPLENITQAATQRRFLVHQNQFGLRAPDDLQVEKMPGRKRVFVFMILIGGGR